jgi:predicted O-methyltransferase YrrM
LSALVQRLRAVRAELQTLAALRVLPLPVAVFFLRARGRARRRRDHFSLASAARPSELATLLVLAEGRERVVELGTGTGWTAAALAVADERRHVVSLDPAERPERAGYLRLAGAAAARVQLRAQLDGAGPSDGDPPVELLFIDSSHEREATVLAFRAWQPALAPGAVVAFHDYGHPEYPGVAEAVADLGLAGDREGGLFVWRAP